MVNPYHGDPFLRSGPTANQCVGEERVASPLPGPVCRSQLGYERREIGGLEVGERE